MANNRTALMPRMQRGDGGATIYLVIAGVVIVIIVVVALVGGKPDIWISGPSVIKNGGSETYKVIGKFDEVQSESIRLTYDDVKVYEARGWNVLLEEFDMYLKQLHVYARGKFDLECTDDGALKGSKGQDAESDYTYSIFVSMNQLGDSEEKSIKCVTEEEYEQLQDEEGEGSAEGETGTEEESESQD